MRLKFSDHLNVPGNKKTTNSPPPYKDHCRVWKRGPYKDRSLIFRKKGPVLIGLVLIGEWDDRQIINSPRVCEMIVRFSSHTKAKKVREMNTPPYRDGGLYVISNKLGEKDNNLRKSLLQEI